MKGLYVDAEEEIPPNAPNPRVNYARSIISSIMIMQEIKELDNIKQVVFHIII